MKWMRDDSWGTWDWVEDNATAVNGSVCWVYHSLTAYAKQYSGYTPGWYIEFRTQSHSTSDNPGPFKTRKEAQAMAILIAATREDDA